MEIYGLSGKRCRGKTNFSCTLTPPPRPTPPPPLPRPSSAPSGSPPLPHPSHFPAPAQTQRVHNFCSCYYYNEVNNEVIVVL